LSFFLFDLREPVHVHVFRGKGRDGQQCKVWIGSMRVAGNHGFNKTEIREILGIVAANREKIITAWENR
jgi:Domain of unknown function (DUF4160)